MTIHFASRSHERAGVERRRRTQAFPALLILFALAGSCGRSPTERERAGVMNWLTCVECDQGERDFVRDSLGQTVVPLLGQALERLPEGYRANMAHAIRAAWARLPNATVSESAYTAHFMSNFDAVIQRRAAISLADLGASNIIEEAIADSAARGYRPDVMNVLRTELARALSIASAAPATPALSVTLLVAPDSVALPVAQQAVLEAVVTDANGTLIPTDVTWSSSNATVATVGLQPNQRAIVTGVSIGQSTVSATSITDSNLTGASAINVVPAAAVLRISVTGGNLQTDTINQILPVPLQVLVTNGAGTPQSGVQVDWSVRYGSGEFLDMAGNSVTSSITSASGTTFVRFRLGSDPDVAMDANVPGASARFRARAISP
jgi:hypothetical protein